jgi:predicted enzyme related to lactoylglutathione lyase
MDFVSVRIITDHVRRLVEFYEQSLQTAAAWSTPDFAELSTPSGTIAIASTRTVALFGVDSARPADNRSLIIEFRVADVDHEYRRLVQLVDEFVQAPTTMPWGNRSLLFRDPDGNLVNFFTPVTVAAEKRQSRS